MKEIYRQPPRLPNVFAEAPPGTIPCFSSLDAFRDYMFAMREQVQRDQKCPAG